MHLRRLLLPLAALAFTPALLLAPATSAAPAGAHVAESHLALARHSCTHTSSGTCIRGGQFCPQRSYRKSGWDAKGRRYVCKGNRTHPHWMKP